MKQADRNAVIAVLAAFAVVVLVFLAYRNVERLRQVAHDSAQIALWHEVNQQLKACEATGEFPAALSELPLAFPDNGSPKMLELINYRRVGAGCRVSTNLRGKNLEQRYGPED